jgi:hypothetical protein
MAKVRVNRDYRVVYATPIEFAKGDELMLGHEDAEYPGWVWVRTPSGNEGWGPLAWIETIGSGLGRALRQYSAVELEVGAGEEVEVMQSLSGWLWVRNHVGYQGWIPADTVAEPVSGR